jgi:hypothetical protein
MPEVHKQFIIRSDNGANRCFNYLTVTQPHHYRLARLVLWGTFASTHLSPLLIEFPKVSLIGSVAWSLAD